MIHDQEKSKRLTSVRSEAASNVNEETAANVMPIEA
jgi:hypothetical protein